MESFLELNPEFQEEYVLLEKIRRKTVFKHIQSLESHLSSGIKLEVLKKLFHKDFYHSSRLKKAYKLILTEESSDVERLIFKILCDEKVYFSDIRLKFVFYKEFIEKRHLFHDANTVQEPFERKNIIFISEKLKKNSYEIQDLIFRKVYLNENVQKELQERLKILMPRRKIFYLLALNEFLDKNFVKNMLFSCKSQEDSEIDLKCWSIGLTALGEDDFYKVLSSELLNATFIDKVKIYRGIYDLIEIEVLLKYLLLETTKNALVIEKMYVSFLKLLELFQMNYFLKIKSLYALMRYFLYEKRIDLFTALFQNIKNATQLDEEIHFYKAMEDFLAEKRSLDYVKKIASKIKDTDNGLSYSFEDIIKKYK